METGMIGLTAYGRALSGSVPSTPSKSVMQRCVAAGLLCVEESVIRNPSRAEDVGASLRMAEALGASLKTEADIIRIKGGISDNNSILNGGESGLGIRLFSSLASLSGGNILITGSGSSLQRPIKQIVNPLRSLGVKVSHNNGFLPIEIKGPIRGGITTVDGALSSQFLTGLLMALPLAKENSEILVSKLNSRPYIDLTLEIMRECGIEVHNNDYKRFTIRGRQEYRPFEKVIEGDWSGAAAILIMGAISGHTTVTGLSVNSNQADVLILDALKLAGAEISIRDEAIECKKRDLRAFNFNITDCPDLAPSLAILGLAAKGETRLRGAGRLRAKESDRAEGLVIMAGRLGGRIKLSGDELIIRGSGHLKGGVVDSFNDHRMAMAAVASSLISESPVEILRPECINKSYPEFYDHFVQLGGTIKTN